MAEEHRPPEPEASMVAALDDAAGTLLSVWEETREQMTSRLSTAQLRAVMVVEQHDGINLRRLATILGMLLSSASRLCDRLVAAGMLEREPGRYDRREISLHLTPEAARLLADLHAARHARLAELLGGMSPDGLAALRRGLGEFRDAARRAPAAKPHPYRAGSAPHPTASVSQPQPQPTASASDPAAPDQRPAGAEPPPRPAAPLATPAGPGVPPATARPA